MRIRLLVPVLLLAVYVTAGAQINVGFSIRPVGRYVAGGYNTEATEIAAYDPATGLLFTTKPDEIAAFSILNETFLVMANEGDTRDYPGYSELARVSDLVLDRTSFPNALALQAPSALGRLRVTTANGDRDGDRDYDELWAFGGRSISIRRTSGALVWDSGDELERIIAAALPANFNSDHVANDFDTRSDDKGPEAEGVGVGTVAGRVLAFATLERISGVVVYDVTNVNQPLFVQVHQPARFQRQPRDRRRWRPRARRRPVHSRAGQPDRLAAARRLAGDQRDDDDLRGHRSAEALVESSLTEEGHGAPSPQHRRINTRRAEVIPMIRPNASRHRAVSEETIQRTAAAGSRRLSHTDNNQHRVTLNHRA